MAVKSNLTPDALAVKILYAAIQMDMDVWAACDFVEKRLSKYHVTIPFDLREKACTIADRKLSEMDELETLMESKKKKLMEQGRSMPYDILVRNRDGSWEAITSLPAKTKQNAAASFLQWVKAQKPEVRAAILAKTKGTTVAVSFAGKIVQKFKMPSSFKINEQAAEEPPRQMADFQAPPQKPVSLDQVVDRYIVRYERESIPLEGQPNGPGIAPNPSAQPAGGTPSTLEESAGLKGLLRFLLEQAPPPPEDDLPPEDDAGAPPVDDAAGAGDLGGGDLGGDTGAPPPGETTPVVNTPQINLNEFSRSIARMVNNYDALLNPRTIILNRVEAYLKSNYNEGTAKYFMQIMERNYGLNITSVEYPEEDSEFPTTYGVGAFAGGAGGGGG